VPASSIRAALDGGGCGGKVGDVNPTSPPSAGSTTSPADTVTADDASASPGTGVVAPGSASTPAPGPATLALDIGGTGLKASVLDAAGTMVADRVRMPTTYPCPPSKLLDDLADLAGQLPHFDRVSAGFPGMVRDGVVLSAPHFVTVHGPGSAVDTDLTTQWARYPLARSLADRLGAPTRVANDADVQGAAVVSGTGLELVVTLGTGVGTALFFHGRLLPHLEFAHFPFRKGDTFNDQLGERVLERVGAAKWNRRVAKAIEAFRGLTFFDHCYIGGGNAHHLSGSLGDDVSVVDNSAGILGGIKLWEGDHVGL
jgi:polyphosphate glucokinase